MKKNKKNAVHTIYKKSDGTRVPGCTTIVGVKAKPQLIAWANRLGINGISMDKYMDDLAQVGSLTHERIQCHFTGAKLDTKEYSQNDIERSENTMKSFNNWVDGVDIKPIFNEKELVSETKDFGGTIDMLAEIDGKNVLIDFKTASGIYDDNFIQLGGYKMLCEEHGYRVDEAMIVRVGRDPLEGYETKKVVDMSAYQEIFEHLRQVYYLEKKIRKQI
jgi:hypothetical protein